MDTVSDRQGLRAWVAQCRRQGKRIGFVPTMGALHQGHLSLVEEAMRRCDVVVASIFVNPTQFGPGEDFASYPRQQERDAELLSQAGCSLLFLPPVTVIYPEEQKTTVTVASLGERFCGASRPGHFSGVATVVTILFNLVTPDVAFFGLKDYQQFTLLRKMVQDLAIPVEMVGVETVREADGLAMSSRNRYLDPRQRQQATALYRALQAARGCYQGGQRQASTVEAAARLVLQEAGITAIDYVALADAETLEPLAPDMGQGRPVMLLAARVGPARLIDNMMLA